MGLDLAALVPLWPLESCGWLCKKTVGVTTCHTECGAVEEQPLGCSMIWMAEAEGDSPTLDWLHPHPNPWSLLLFMKGLVASS